MVSFPTVQTVNIADHPLSMGSVWSFLQRPLLVLLFSGSVFLSVPILAQTPAALSAEIQSSPITRSKKTLPLPGETIEIQGHQAFIILPKNSHRKTPWVWYAPTLEGLPGAEEMWMFEQFTRAGIAVAGVDVGESYGNPQGRALFTAFYKHLIQRHNFSRKPCLLARSRGGLMLYNWAVEHPKAVAGLAGIYPVCDLRSYPGLKTASAAFGLTEIQLADQLSAHNPVDRLKPLAKARVPIFHIHGDQDSVVPLEQNSGAVAKNYASYGGLMETQVITGRGHDMWVGWFQSQVLVDFVIRVTTAAN